MKYSCPFCYKTMPQGYVPSAWGCCGEVGHAVAMASDTPRTDLAQFAGIPEMGRGSRFVVEADFARELERELHAAIICAGVASKERGEWAIEREYLRVKFGELRSAVEKVLDDWANENVVRCDSRQQVERVLNSVASF